MTVFGPILGPGDAEQAMLDHLKKWLSTYLAEVDEQSGLARGYSAIPRHWEVVPALDLSQRPQFPAVFIVSPGSNEPGAKEGDGTIRMTYELTIAPVVKARDDEATNALLKRYIKAIHTCIMQKRSLGDPNVFGTDYDGTNHISLPVEERRTIQGALVRFSVTYSHVANTKMGPAMPILDPDPNADPPVDPTTPYPDWSVVPDADHIGTTVTKQ